MKLEEEVSKDYTDGDGNVIYTDDYNENMSGKERRGEKRSNRKAIRKSGLKGKAKRAAKKANRQQNRAARKSARCVRLEGKGKTHKRFYRKNCM